MQLHLSKQFVMFNSCVKYKTGKGLQTGCESVIHFSLAY